MPVAEVVESYTEYDVAWATELQVTLIVFDVVGAGQVAATPLGAPGRACVCDSPELVVARRTVQLVAADANAALWRTTTKQARTTTGRAPRLTRGPSPSSCRASGGERRISSSRNRWQETWSRCPNHRLP